VVCLDLGEDPFDQTVEQCRLVGNMLYDRRVPMRPDWENIMPGMVDALAADPEADAQRIVLVGRSFWRPDRAPRRRR
jgi:hypothetical protein